MVSTGRNGTRTGGGRADIGWCLKGDTKRIQSLKTRDQEEKNNYGIV